MKTLFKTNLVIADHKKWKEGHKGVRATRALPGMMGKSSRLDEDCWSNQTIFLII
jgi:hypothetical protein